MCLAEDHKLRSPARMEDEYNELLQRIDEERHRLHIDEDRLKKYINSLREKFCDDDMQWYLKNNKKANSEIEKAENIDISSTNLFAVCRRLPENKFSNPVTFYESISERYFEATMEQVLDAEYHLNRNYSLGKEVTLNDFYGFLGIPEIETGDMLGWNFMDESMYWIDFNHRKSEFPDGRIFYIIDIATAPCNIDD